ncbi:MAG: DUF2079 domain-containing protein [candidate division Zixibacteria bacterium]|nr:DUF2079 domain-containing protein [candidate division Zixibacteria bacterium]
MLFKNFRNWCRDNEQFLIPSLVIFAVIYLLRVKLLQHYTFHTHAFDLAVFDTSLFNTVRGNFMFSEQLGRSYFSEHFSPLLLMYYPLYLVFNTPLTLLVTQVLFGAGCLWFLYQLSRHYELDPALSLLICLIFLNYKYFARGMMYDFHIEMAVPFFLLGAVWFLLAEKKPGYWTFLFLALMCKEDIVIYTFCLGVFIMLLRRHRLVGLLTLVISVVWAVAVWKFILPAFNPVDSEISRFITRWGHLGDDYLQVFLAVLSSPLMVLERLFSYTPLQMLSLLVGFPVLAPEILIIAGPGLILNLTSQSGPQSSLHLYYAAPILPFLFWSFVVGVKRLKRFCDKKNRSTHSNTSLWLTVVLLLLALGTFGDNYYFFAWDTHIAPRKAALEKIPENAVVSAQTNFIPHLIRKAQTYQFPEEREVSFYQTQYILLDFRLDKWPLKKDEYSNLVNSILNDTNRYESIYDNDSVYLILNKKLSDKP